MALWDLYQQMEIRGTRAEVRAADEAHGSRIERAQQQTEKLELRLEKLLLVNEAMWELFSEHLGFTEAHLVHKLHELDSRSGVVDGRRARVVRRCSNCDAAIGQDRSTCVFCGHEAGGLTPFDQV